MDGDLPGLTGEHFYNIAALFSGSAYLMRNILWLGVPLVVAALAYIVSGINLGIASMIGWNTTYLLINLFHIGILMIDKLTINLPEETRKIYQRFFTTMSTREFKKIIMSNEFRLFQDDTIIHEHQIPGELFINLRGEVNIVKKDANIATPGAGDFIGEMSFLSRERASPTARAENLVQCAFWTHDDLDRLKYKNINLYDRFIAIIGRDLVRKLKYRNDKHLDQVTRLDYVI